MLFCGVFVVGVGGGFLELPRLDRRPQILTLTASLVLLFLGAVFAVCVFCFSSGAETFLVSSGFRSVALTYL